MVVDAVANEPPHPNLGSLYPNLSDLGGFEASVRVQMLEFIRGAGKSGNWLSQLL